MSTGEKFIATAVILGVMSIVTSIWHYSWATRMSEIRAVEAMTQRGVDPLAAWCAVQSYEKFLCATISGK